jgi:hypothetical protein
VLEILCELRCGSPKFIWAPCAKRRPNPKSLIKSTLAYRTKVDSGLGLLMVIVLESTLD